MAPTGDSAEAPLGSEPASPSSTASPSAPPKTAADELLFSPSDPRHVGILRRGLPNGGTRLPLAEQRGLTVQQLRTFLHFVAEHCRKWCDLRTGKPLALQSIDFYQLADWVIKPVAEQQNCSVVELFAASEQPPRWYVIHWWGESLLGCWESVEVHCDQRLDTLGDIRLTEDTPFWQYAFSGRLNSPTTESIEDLRNASFYRAMQGATGSLLIVGRKDPSEGESVETGLRAPFTRTWCLAEMWAGSIDMRKLFDVAVYSCSGVELVTSGLTHHEKKMERSSLGTGLQNKSRREASFPVEVLESALSLELETSQASEDADRSGILNWFAGVSPVDSDPPIGHPSIRKASLRLRALLAEAAWTRAVLTENASLSELSKALAADRWRSHLMLKIPFCSSLDDGHLSSLGQALSESLQQFDLDVRRCPQISDVGLAGLAEGLPRNLQVLRLDFASCPRICNAGISALAARLPVTLSDLHLSFEGCRGIGTEGALQLAERLPPDLRGLSLTLTGTNGVDDPVAMAFAHRIPGKLRSLHLLFDGCDLTHEAVEALAPRLPPSLQILRLSFCDCKKVSDAAAISIAQHMPPCLHTLHIGLTNCRGVTDLGSAALAQSLPSSLSRVALNLGGTRVQQDRAGLCRHLPTIRTWQLPVASGTGRGGGGPALSQSWTAGAAPGTGSLGRSAQLENVSSDAAVCTLPSTTSAPSLTATPPVSLRLPSVHLRINRGLGESKLSVKADYDADPLSPASHIARNGRLRRSSQGWRAKPFRPEAVKAYPRWHPAILSAAPESMFSRSESAPSLSLGAMRLSAWQRQGGWVP
eukprot:TRINITY_DN15599_c0_g1_i1.p1 TRINITY_DN15599_c0_g1~~TRINITY_DN15599_c0_g1_i1.p1  ORF type:complete len:822 (-),score=76.23 TRINITY_DN15599_c0_g1_i1:128-2572(-)